MVARVGLRGFSQVSDVEKRMSSLQISEKKIYADLVGLTQKAGSHCIYAISHAAIPHAK